MQRSFGIPLLAPYALVSFRCGLDHLPIIIPSVSAAVRSDSASLRIAVDSGVLLPRKANSIGRVLPAVLRSSSVVAADSLTTTSRLLWSPPAAATDSPSCTPTDSAPAARGSSETDDRKDESSSPPVCLP